MNARLWGSGMRVVNLPIAVLALVQVSTADDSLLGDWAGGFDDGKDYVFLQLHFKSKDGRISGTYDAPLLFQRGRSLRDVAMAASQVSFEIPTKPEARRFTGEVKNGVLAGQLKEGGTERPFQFTRLAMIRPENYVGAYQIQPGHFLSIRAGVELGISALQFIDFKTGRVSVFFPTSPTNFFRDRPSWCLTPSMPP